MCWLFRKRTFAVSGDFLESLKTSIIENRVNRLVQTDILGGEVSPKVEWIFIGIFPAKRLGIDCNEWRKIITDRDVLREILEIENKIKY